jgi:hypothetical protein
MGKSSEKCKKCANKGSIMPERLGVTSYLGEDFWAGAKLITVAPFEYKFSFFF